MIIYVASFARIKELLGQLTIYSSKGKVVPVLNLIKHYAMKAYEGVDV
jgi:hypothetical protein